ncbi:MAG TPA: hypothetical protein VJ583_05690 [Nitrososphaeraceae archaeon]|nr:hypothetical protein [Nitrososphaeraceae archaeon]
MQNKQTILQNWNNEQVSINDIISNIFNLLNINNIEIKNKVIEISRNSTGKNPSDQWFYVLKIVSIYCVKNSIFFYQSQLYDLLTILSRILDDRKKDVVNTITFNIYKDIMENYNKLSDTLRLIFPVVIVNLMYILKYGHDLGGKPINIYAINNYYQNSKLNLENELKKILSFNIEINNTQDNKIVRILKKITERNEKEIQIAFQNLIESDQKKIEDICNNYQKLQEYYKIIETDGFSEIIEKEARRKLSGSQLQHAVYSIKKTKLYLENLLDGAFVPSGKHRINHIKHNIEYGFQLAGILQSKRKKYIFDKNNL